MAIWILRVQADFAPVEPPAIERFQALYEEMKRYHWWLTNPDDFPACAILVGQEGSAADIGAGIESIYQALHAGGGSRGNPLQTAANLLYLARVEPGVAAGRFHALAEGFRRADVAIWQSRKSICAALTCWTTGVFERSTFSQSSCPAPYRLNGKSPGSIENSTSP